MVDATKVPSMVEYSHKYVSCVGGEYPNHDIIERDNNQEQL